MSYRVGLVRTGTGPADFERFVIEELNRIAAAFEETVSNPVTLYKAEPKRVLNRIVAADGASWDPGSGAGLYYWDGAAWAKL